MLPYSKRLIWPSVQNFIEFNFHESFKNGTLIVKIHLRFARHGHSKLQNLILKSAIPSLDSAFTKNRLKASYSGCTGGLFFQR